MDYNYFEVLELSIDDIQDEDEATIKNLVDAAHTKLYAFTIGAYANIPRTDGLTQAQYQKVLNDAKETLLDPGKRRKHIADLMPEPEATHAPETTETPEPEAKQAPETTEIPEPEAKQAPKHKWTKYIALGIGQLLIAISLWSLFHHTVSPGNIRDILLTLLITNLIALALLFYAGFIQYCWYATYAFFYDYYPWTYIRFLRDCVAYKMYRPLIAIFAVTLAGGLGPYGIRLVKLGFVSSGISVASIDFVTSDFLSYCFTSFTVVAPFVRGAFYRRLGLMIKRLIMMGILLLAYPLGYSFAEIFDSHAFEASLVLSPAALLLIFYYTVGYIRYTRNQN
ncbi:MAG: hypothetical protein OXI24_14135 [Candidatus Poribacteria bacterium]|nr:hypothetical protein [Candidatus Poribacteria bacterium]